MVDAFVSIAVQQLGDFLIQEVSLRSSLREDVQWLRNELLFMQSFLKDAEQKQSGDQRVQQWVFEINSVANDAVVILETYSFEGSEGEGEGDGFASRLKDCACICRKETKFYKVGKEIQSLKQRIRDISRKRETYGIRNIDNITGEEPTNWPKNGSDMVRTLRRTTSYVDEDHIFVGFQDVVEKLLAELLKAEPRRSVISIYAMEGLAREMVNKCGGLPLAIVVLSGLLLHKKGLEEWQKVKAHLWQHMKDDSIEISYILSLSYNDLSPVLKQCFLYFGIFPEDRVICANNIMWFWMAEGFIPNGEENGGCR
ncbi:hypothetical protein HAX54_050707 [Datura stramonium]|uniref:Disease resistance N-terminal domain-containing protein n=1 Tax=Datura stramonium TaxID=4076 RepID=A0ABS8WRF8_DATST|nr:hypothetical protein [Datura stramonium]